jgi:flagellar hook assembly protein FlgD
MENMFLKFAKNWLIQSMISTLALSGMFTIFTHQEASADSQTYDYEYTSAGATVDPRLRTVYTTKAGFDPGREEVTNIVFTLTADADIEVSIYNEDDEKVETLLNKKDLEKGIYVVEWNGENYIDAEEEFTYKIEVKNADGEDTAEGQIEVAQDEKSNRKPNIYKDKVEEIPYKPENNELTISFKLDKEGEVTVEIRDGNYLIDTLTEDENMEAGYNSVSWDGKNEDGEYVENGIYEYKISSINDKGKDVERGEFSVEEAEDAIEDEDKDDDNNDDDDNNVCIDCDNGNDNNNDDDNNGNDSNFYDVSKNNKYYDAIMWAKNMGIFEGYYGNYFMPNEPISRAEALKVILEVMDVDIAKYKNENFCFDDVCDSSEWYMSYLKTGLALGIVKGYPDDTFKPNQSVNRIEALVMLLRTGEVVDDLVISTKNCGKPYYDTPNDATTKWYINYVWTAKNYELTDSSSYFRPEDAMTRGEMADMLYRYYFNLPVSE